MRPYWLLPRVACRVIGAAYPARLFLVELYTSADTYSHSESDLKWATISAVLSSSIYTETPDCSTYRACDTFSHGKRSDKLSGHRSKDEDGCKADCQYGWSRQCVAIALGPTPDMALVVLVWRVIRVDLQTPLEAPKCMPVVWLLALDLGCTDGKPRSILLLSCSTAIRSRRGLSLLKSLHTSHITHQISTAVCWWHKSAPCSEYSKM